MLEALLSPLPFPASRPSLLFPFDLCGRRWENTGSEPGIALFSAHAEMFPVSGTAKGQKPGVFSAYAELLRSHCIRSIYCSSILRVCGAVAGRSSQEDPPVFIALTGGWWVSTVLMKHELGVSSFGQEERCTLFHPGCGLACAGPFFLAFPQELEESNLPMLFWRQRV